MRVRIALLFVLISSLAKAQPSADIVEYINNYKQLAMQEMKRTGIPAAVKLAQGVHETYAGKSDLVVMSNNHFGIKCKAEWTGKKVYHDDDSRGECFRKYDSAADSYRDHSNFLKSSDRYSFLFRLDPTDYKAWATGLKKAGYATNPKYAPIIIKIIEDYNLEQYTLIAMGRMSPSDEVVAQVLMPATNTPDVKVPWVMEPEQPALEVPPPVEAMYPPGEFVINNTRVIFAKEGVSLLSVAQQYDIPLSRLIEFNELGGKEVLSKDQLVYLQRKRKTGMNEYHVVTSGESLYDICQQEAMRLESLLEFNHLQKFMQPAVGEKLYLHTSAPIRPKL
ncbi:MAG: glucosaminidase domain-containing protein [Flavitalea sp.]